MKNPLVSIIILVHDNLKFIDGAIESVLKTDYENIEVIIVDNASTDGSYQYLRAKTGKERRIKMIRNRVNMGFAEGNNVGVRNAKGEYLTFLNIDTIVAPDWIDPIVSVLDADNSIGACQSKLLQMNDHELFDSAGDFIDKYGVMMRRGGDVSEKDRGQYDKNEEIFSGRGAALTVRNELFKRVGAFDSSYFLTYEDIDLCWRIRLFGYKVVFVPKSVVYHCGGFSLSTVRVFFSTRNWLTTLVKNYGLSNLFKIMPGALMIAFYAALFEVLAKKKPIQSYQRTRGFLSVILNFKSIWAKRLRVQNQIRKVEDPRIITQMVDLNLAVSHWRHISH